MYNEVFIQRKLQNAEYEQLVERGYFKLRITLNADGLSHFQSTHHVGDEIIFHAPDQSDVSVRVTSVDMAKFDDNNFKVFVGFTLM